VYRDSGCATTVMNTMLAREPTSFPHFSTDRRLTSPTSSMRRRVRGSLKSTYQNAKQGQSSASRVRLNRISTQHRVRSSRPPVRLDASVTSSRRFSSSALVPARYSPPRVPRKRRRGQCVQL